MALILYWNDSSLIPLIWGSVLLRWATKMCKKNENFESALHSTSWSMPLIKFVIYILDSAIKHGKHISWKGMHNVDLY